VKKKKKKERRTKNLGDGMGSIPSSSFCKVDNGHQVQVWNAQILRNFAKKHLEMSRF
jgi:hypothetical protein